MDMGVMAMSWGWGFTFSRASEQESHYRIYVFTPIPARAGCDIEPILKRSLTGLDSEFSFFKTGCLNKIERSSLRYNLLIAGGRIGEYILFLRVLVLCKMQSASSRIWTRVDVSISYDDNHYTTSCSLASSQASPFWGRILFYLIIFRPHLQIALWVKTATILRRIL